MELPPIWSTQHGNRWKLLKNHSIDRAWGSYWALLIKSQPHPSNTISLIRWQKQWHLNSDPALGRKKKEVMPEPTRQQKSKTVLLSVIRNGTGKKRNKCKSSHCLKKRKGSLTPLYAHAHTHFLCIVWTATSRKKLGLLIALWWSFISGLACLSW